MMSSTLCAHTGEPLRLHDLWTAWSFEPGIVTPLAISAILYARGAHSWRGVTIVQSTCFWTGWMFLALALISPLHPLGEELFSAHMAQHEILMLVAAPLLVLSRPLIPMLWSLPIQWRRTSGQWSRATPVQVAWSRLTSPLPAWCLHAAALWLWHIPVLFQATLRSEWIHAAQHASFFGSALLFWWSLLHARGRSGYGAGVLYLFTTAIHTSILGVLLTFASSAWYPAYAAGARDWGLTPIEDQQIGGLIMWIPAGLVYLGAGLALLACWISESEIMALRRDYAR